jgi:hypothetical protein
MFDLKNESVLALSQAARRIPLNHNGKGVHVGTLMRWIRKGVKGVRLEATRLGGRWVTSPEAIQRFADRLAGVQFAKASPCPQPSRTAAADRADQELERLGF